MFADKVYREESSRGGKGRKRADFGHSDGMAQNRGAVWAFDAKRGNMKKAAFRIKACLFNGV